MKKRLECQRRASANHDALEHRRQRYKWRRTAQFKNDSESQLFDSLCEKTGKTAVVILREWIEKNS